MDAPNGYELYRWSMAKWLERRNSTVLASIGSKWFDDTITFTVL